MRVGALIEYRLRLHGLRVDWLTRIERVGARACGSWTASSPGPYRLWHHTHTFEEHDGGTLMRDVVRYALPAWPLGELAAARWCGATWRGSSTSAATRRRIGDRPTVTSHK